jgi:hypothetical protein
VPFKGNASHLARPEALCHVHSTCCLDLLPGRFAAVRGYGKRIPLRAPLCLRLINRNFARSDAWDNFHRPIEREGAPTAAEASALRKINSNEACRGIAR